MSTAMLRAAAVQMLPAPGEPAANIERAERLAREAALQGARLIVFPECTASGYTMPGAGGLTLEQHRRWAELVPGPSIDRMAALAADLRAYIVWGLHEQRGDRYFNTAALLGPEGELLGTYSKVHINKYERCMGWTNGDGFRVWECQLDGILWRSGTMICFDREVPEAARCLAVLGADVIAVPQATSCTCDLPIHRDQLRVRAYENECFVVMANWAGEERKGHSMVIDFRGEVLALGGRDEEILIADLDLAALREYRDGGIYGRHHRQPAAYGPLLVRD
jgi:N-carbamoylputrescine amidase